MLKSLFATCLTAISVNTQPLAVSRSSVPSRALSSSGVLLNEGDIYSFSIDLISPNNVVASYSSVFDTLPSSNLFTYTEFNYTFTGGSIRLSNTSNNFGFSGIEFLTGTTGLGTSSSSYIFRLLSYTGASKFAIYAQPDTTFFHIDFTFRVVSNVIVSDSFYSFLIKDYAPPKKSNIYRFIYEFYYSIFNDSSLELVTTDFNMPFDSWLCHSLTIITLLAGIFVLFLLLRWLFRIISGLVLLKH